MNAIEAAPEPIAMPATPAADPSARTTLKWRFKEHWWGESAKFDLGGLVVYVADCDGDRSFWTIRRGQKGPIIAEGESAAANHWDLCLGEAQTALLEIVAKRIAELRTNAAARQTAQAA